MSLCRDMMPTWELRAAMESAEAKVTEQSDRIAQLEAALRVFTCDCTISERCAVPDNCCNFQARRTLEERT
jgi:hypothetical protein